MKVGGLFLFAVLLTLSKELQAAGICVVECRGDQDCGAGERCISNGCGHVCSRAEESEDSGICEHQCREDKDCGRGKQCIRKGCGHICSYTARTGLCEQQCRRHQDCGAGKQCIRKGCSRVCSPTPDAEGKQVGMLCAQHLKNQGPLRRPLIISLFFPREMLII
ncbi:uncharacterized protein [Vicugna pacos]|uniref:Uncharacterized protein isoform X3 n=1 Tax=Vicugna pacos TaxID=30538 RepID=A0ABM5BJ28_VICPA